MATVVNTQPGTTTDSSANSMMTMIFGVVVVALIAFFLFYFAPSMMRRAGSGNTGESQPAAQPANLAPQGDSGIQIPEQIDVNVNMPNQGQP